MPKRAKSPSHERVVKTGRRIIPSFEARDKTVCFNLGESEKDGVDDLAFCMNITRSGLLAQIVSEFVKAAKDGPEATAAETSLADYLIACREAFKVRGELASTFRKH